MLEVRVDHIGAQLGQDPTQTRGTARIPPARQIQAVERHTALQEGSGESMIRQWAHRHDRDIESRGTCNRGQINQKMLSTAGAQIVDEMGDAHRARAIAHKVCIGGRTSGR